MGPTRASPQISDNSRGSWVGLEICTYHQIGVLGLQPTWRVPQCTKMPLACHYYQYKMWPSCEMGLEMLPGAFWAADAGRWPPFL